MDMDIQLEFDRHSRIYKQFKVRNTRTSTPQPSIGPRYLTVRRDPPVQPTPQPPSTCPDVDTTYVSYVQWRHYLDMPNSARKFKIRGTRTTSAAYNSIISGNINLLPAPIISTTSEQMKQNRIKPLTEELLNSRIAEEEDFRELRQQLEARNRRIVDLVIPAIKRSLKRFVVGSMVEPVNYLPTQPKSAKRSEKILGLGGLSRSLKKQSEDRELLIYAYDDVEE